MPVIRDDRDLRNRHPGERRHDDGCRLFLRLSCNGDWFQETGHAPELPADIAVATLNNEEGRALGFPETFLRAAAGGVSMR